MASEGRPSRPAPLTRGAACTWWLGPGASVTQLSGPQGRRTAAPSVLPRRGAARGVLCVMCFCSACVPRPPTPSVCVTAPVPGQVHRPGSAGSRNSRHGSSSPRPTLVCLPLFAGKLRSPFLQNQLTQPETQRSTEPTQASSRPRAGKALGHPAGGGGAGGGRVGGRRRVSAPLTGAQGGLRRPVQIPMRSQWPALRCVQRRQKRRLCTRSPRRWVPCGRARL